MKDHITQVQGGGSLLLAWQVRGRKVIVVGGGEVAAGRILNLLNADAHVFVISPTVNHEIQHRLYSTPPCLLTHIPRKFHANDLHDNLDAALVLTAVDDPAASSEIYHLAHSLRIPANIADVPPECDFYFGSVHRDGPLQIMVSTNGNGPKLASIVRKHIARSLPVNVGEAITKVGELRRRLRRVARGIEEGPKRMAWMSRVCEQWTLEELCELNEEDMDVLLRSYVPNKVPTFDQVRIGEQLDTIGFDGSYGWSCVI